MKGSFAQLGGNGYVDHEKYLEFISGQQARKQRANKKSSRRKNFVESLALAARFTCRALHARARLVCVFARSASH